MHVVHEKRTATHCNTVQRTATQCNTLQHTATHCNTLQHTATYCNALPPHCHILQHTATHCSTLQHTATHCHTLQHTAHTATHRNIHKEGNATRTAMTEGGIERWGAGVEYHFQKNLMSPTPRRKWYLTTGRRAY